MHRRQFSRSVFFGAPIAVGLAACDRPRSSDRASTHPLRRRDQALIMSAPAYTTQYADPYRSSLVDVTPNARYRHLERLVLDGPHRLEGAATEVLADGTRVVVRYGIRTVVLEPYGSREFWAAEGGVYWIASLTADALVMGPRVHPWDDSPMRELPPTDMFHERGDQWIGRQQGHLWLLGVHKTPAWAAESLSIRLVDTQARDEDDEEDEPPSGRTVWALFWKGVRGSTAVCAPDGRVLATESSRRIAIVGPDADPTARDELSRPKPRIVMSGETDLVVHNCSAIDPGFALLASPNENRSGPASLIALDDQGREQWRASVPFRIDVEVEPTLHRPPHPPIALGDGRILVAGAGLACFADGKLLWSRPSPDRVAATVLGSEAIAVAIGRQLQILQPDGSVRDAVDLPGDAKATTSPAVAPDGTLYVGTTAAVYAIR
jgi:hypothetical protein